jgi:hypothetical protein
VHLLRRTLVILILVGSALAFTAVRPAWACSCASNADPLESAEVAFTGIATDVDRPPAIGGVVGPVTVTVAFDVESVEKGETGREVELTTSSEGASCGYEFTERHRYRVYARDGRTSLCDGNEDLGLVAAPQSAVPTVRWTTAGAALIVAAAAIGYLWLRRRRAQ